MTKALEELGELVEFLASKGVTASAEGCTLSITTPKGYHQFKELWWNPSSEEEEEAHQAYADYGGPNHSNHDLFAENFFCNDDGHLLTPTGQGYYHCPECDWKGFISDEDLYLGRFQED